jgi:hypothetical protein
MMVQIVLIQKFQLFIGSPTYGVIVVLGGMLLFSGIGSLVIPLYEQENRS